MSTYLFTYGTLVNRHFTGDMLGHDITSYSETLSGYKKIGLNIVESPEDEVEGVAYEVSKADLKILDNYEGVDHKLYKRIDVVLASGEKAIAYQLV